MNDCDSDGVLVHWALPTDFFWPGIGSCETCGSVLICAGFTPKHNRQIEENLEQKLISLLQLVLALSEVSYYGSWLLSVSSPLMSCVTRRKLQTPGNAEEHKKKKNKKHLQSTQLAQPTNLTDQGPSTTERTAWETHNTARKWH